MLKLCQPATIAALLAFSELATQEQDRVLTAVNQYLLASPVQKRSMVDIWKDEAKRSGVQVQLDL
ncbi:hypothetical protein [Paraburkholderia acidiphila]|uniref:Uncharacterized protein n=1 Tax=Paraburkholderia acidiphila TaxID=2571747 RepID=A0A7Z2GBH8_9BURK|nr:hypothetical protein [Paraburkholderia acidiphila]QGZ58589.1 hypothetical protein FAZ97_26775 [Paraburkholderia acidiphila]